MKFLAKPASSFFPNKKGEKKGNVLAYVFPFSRDSRGRVPSPLSKGTGFPQSLDENLRVRGIQGQVCYQAGDLRPLGGLPGTHERPRGRQLAVVAMQEVALESGLYHGRFPEDVVPHDVPHGSKRAPAPAASVRGPGWKA